MYSFMVFEIISIKGMNLPDEIAEGSYLHPAMMAEIHLCSQHQFANAEFLLQTKTQTKEYLIFWSIYFNQ